MKDKCKILRPGDLVILGKVGRVNSMVLWATWNDMDYTAQEVKFWPAIIGHLKKGEVALVLEVCMPRVGPHGAKVCAPHNVVGWINCRCLKKLDGDPVET